LRHIAVPLLLTLFLIGRSPHIVRAVKLNYHLRAALVLGIANPTHALPVPVLYLQSRYSPKLEATAGSLEALSANDARRRDLAALVWALSDHPDRAELLWSRSSLPTSKLNLGRLRWTSGKPEEALQFWNNPTGIQWLTGLLETECQTHSSNLPKIEAILRFVLSQSEGPFETQYRRGMLAICCGRYADALPNFLRALRLRPNDFSSLSRVAQSYGSCRREDLPAATHSEVILPLEHLSRLLPHYADLHILLAIAYCCTSQPYERVIEQVGIAKSLGLTYIPPDLEMRLAKHCRDTI